MKRHYRKYSDYDIIENTKKVKSMAQLLKLLNLKESGSNYCNIKKHIQRLNLDCSHWKGKAWNHGERLKNWSEYTRASRIKPHLIKERGHKCEGCNLSEWQGNKIPLEIEHSNGDRTDNSKENLKLLCCNCHALTPTWRGRNAKA